MAPHCQIAGKRVSYSSVFPLHSPAAVSVKAAGCGSAVELTGVPCFRGDAYTPGHCAHTTHTSLWVLLSRVPRFCGCTCPYLPVQQRTSHPPLQCWGGGSPVCSASGGSQPGQSHGLISAGWPLSALTLDCHPHIDMPLLVWRTLGGTVAPRGRRVLAEDSGP